MKKRIELEREQIYRGNLILVNERYPLKTEEETGMIPVDSHFPEILMKGEAAWAVQRLLEKIGAGDSILPVSGYRSGKEQTEIYETSLVENGREFTRKYVALPNHSEHQTGLAIDLGLAKEEIDFIRPDFPYEGICDKFRQSASEYGLVERYEKKKEELTGIAQEPWHFRYVGCPHAELMKKKGLCLEEYVEYIRGYRAEKPCRFRQADGMETEIYFVPAETDMAQAEIPEGWEYGISGNNVDGFIITLWRKRDE